MKVELKGMRDKISGMERKQDRMERTQDRMKVRQDYFSSLRLCMEMELNYLCIVDDDSGLFETCDYDLLGKLNCFCSI